MAVQLGFYSHFGAWICSTRGNWGAQVQRFSLPRIARHAAVARENFSRTRPRGRHRRGHGQVSKSHRVFGKTPRPIKFATMTCYDMKFIHYQRWIQGNGSPMMGICFKLFQSKKCLNCCRLLLTLCCNAFLCHYATWIHLEYLFILRGGATQLDQKPSASWTFSNCFLGACECHRRVGFNCSTVVQPCSTYDLDWFGGDGNSQSNDRLLSKKSNQMQSIFEFESSWLMLTIVDADCWYCHGLHGSASGTNNTSKSNA